jgi:hypothetical protein
VVRPGTGAFDSRPKLLGFHMSGPGQIKLFAKERDIVKKKERRFIT